MLSIQKHALPAVLVFLFLTLLLQAAAPRHSPAATFMVNSQQDINDLEPGNGLCVAYLIVFPPYVFPFCTLRGAIEEANRLPGPDTILIPQGTYTLSIEGMDEEDAATGDLDITETLSIIGAGTDKTVIDANGIDRIFDISGQGTNVTISALSMINGSLPDLLGDSSKGGGGIRNAASLTLTQTSLQGNNVNGAEPGDVGGGLLNLAACSITDSTIQGNNAQSGGAIYNDFSGLLDITASTINANFAETGSGLANYGSARIVNVTVSGNDAIWGTLPHGGGILNNGEIDIFQSTIADNYASGYGGGIANDGSISMVNTIVSDNMNGNCSSTTLLLSGGSNLDSDDSCGLDTESDLINLDPRLDQLRNNGGPTQTHALLMNSPAIDRGTDLSSEGISTDQRGVIRPLGDGFDIGAFETQKISIVPLLSPLLIKAAP